MKDYYKIFEVDANTTQEDIRRRYLFLARVWHSDRFSKPEDKAMADEKLKEINEAYEVLGNPAKRAQHDKERSEAWFDEEERRQERERAEARQQRQRAEEERQQREQTEERRRRSELEQHQRERAEAERRRFESERQQREQAEMTRLRAKQRWSVIAILSLALIFIFGYGAIAVNQPPKVATVTMESATRDLQLVKVISVSSINVDNSLADKPRYWTIVIRNDDNAPHSAKVLFQWAEDLNFEFDRGTNTQGNRIEESEVQEFWVDPNSEQSFRVVIRGCCYDYGNFQNFTYAILTVDGLPYRPIDKILDLIQINATNPQLVSGGSGLEFVCHMSVTNNDTLPHDIAGVVHIAFTYNYLDEIRSEERSLDLANFTYVRVPSGQTIGTGENNSDVFSPELSEDFNDPNKLAGPINVRAVIKLVDEWYGNIPEEMRTREIQLPGCQISK